MPPSPDFRKKLPRTLGLPFLKRADEIYRSFSASGRFIFYCLAGLIAASSLGLIYMLDSAFLVTVPARGGAYNEGLIGSPRFINPVLALSDADHDMTALVYSGLLRAEADGTFAPDLASDYSISDDGRVYTVHIRTEAKFQDGTPVSADDVIYTINQASDPAIKSPLRANWNGITVTETDAHTVQFTLAKPYAPFIENLTLGIMPRHLWQNVSVEEFPFSDLNTSPIGSGPYKVSKVSRSSSGIPSSYRMSAFSGYALGSPYISTLTLRFYQNEDALAAGLKSGEVEAASGLSSASVANLKGFNVVSVPLSRVFGVFFNQNQNPALQDLNVRKALALAIDRSALVKTVLGGYGEPLNGPIPPSIDPSAAIVVSTSTQTGDPALAARQMLLNAGWKPNAQGVLQKTTGTGKNVKTVTLAFAISTGNVPELRASADYLKAQWGQMGAQVDIQVYDQGDLSENVIRPRKYDGLLFGEIVGRGLDLFAFWDSSQRNDPGLNIALYANSSVDSLLEQLRTANTDSARQALYAKIETQIQADAPAVFLYAPDFLYVVPEDVSGMEFGQIESPSDRFDNVERWYRTTDKVWQMFAPKK